MIKQVTVQELKDILDKKANIQLVDCRERDEHQYCHIEGATLIPLSEFETRAEQELKADVPVYIHCHHGGRSQRACQFLESKGFQDLNNMTGGIDHWSLHIDSKIPRY